MQSTVCTDQLEGRIGQVLDGVAGWTHPAEGAYLYRLARAAATVDTATIVEIGSHSGRSAIALALGVKESGGCARVYAVDPHETRRDGQDTWGAINRNLERAAVSDLVELIRLRSHDARDKFADASVAVLFVDGSHDYEDVLTDIRDWGTAMRDGGVVAFNDPTLPGVSRALREAVLCRNSPYRLPRWIVNTVVFEYAPSRPWSWRDAVSLQRARAFLWLNRVEHRLYKRVVASDLPRQVKGLAARLRIRVTRPVLRLLLPRARVVSDSP